MEAQQLAEARAAAAARAAAQAARDAEWQRKLCDHAEDGDTAAGSWCDLPAPCSHTALISSNLLFVPRPPHHGAGMAPFYPLPRPDLARADCAGDAGGGTTGCRVIRPQPAAAAFTKMTTPPMSGRRWRGGRRGGTTALRRQAEAATTPRSAHPAQIPLPPPATPSTFPSSQLLSGSWV